jgi:hypothetical protein
MSWRTKITDNSADILRFLIHGALLMNGVILALGSIYFVGKLVFFTLQWINKVLFGSPW